MQPRAELVNKGRESSPETSTMAAGMRAGFMCNLLYFKFFFSTFQAGLVHSVQSAPTKYFAAA